MGTNGVVHRILAFGIISCISLVSLSFAALYDMDEQFGSGSLYKNSAAARQAKTEEILGRLRPGDVVDLSRRFSTGDIDATALPDGVTIRWGHEGRFFLGRAHYDKLTIQNTDVEFVGGKKTASPAKTIAASRQTTITNSTLINMPAISYVNMDNSKIIEYKAGGSGYGQWNVTGSWKNNSLLYLWYHTQAREAGGPPHINFDNVDATGSRIYGIIEVNYCFGSPSVVFNKVTGLTYGNGDTERHNSPLGVYHLIDCADMTLVCHRNYSSKGSSCPKFIGNGYLVNRGKNINFFGIVDIGASNDFSIRVSSSPGFNYWGGFYESKIVESGENGNIVKTFLTPEGFGGAAPNAWVAPAIVSKEIVFDYQGVRIDTTTTQAPDLSKLSISKPPLIPPLHLLDDKIGYAKTSAEQAPGASWGSDCIAAGADPTGRRASDAAVQAVLDRSRFVELPAGKLLFSRSVVIPCRTGSRAIRIVGAGDKRTTIRTTGNFSAFVHENAAAFMAKAGNAQAELSTVEIARTAFDGGGTKDYEFFYSSHASTRHENLTFRNYRKAAVIIGNASNIDNLSYIIKGDGYDQVRWHNCSFINTGDYGLFSNRDQCDKQLYYRCVFENQKKAGLAIVRSHMIEASSIVNCTFRNINGPGVKFGYNDVPGIGTPPGPAMVMNCLFEECGNDREAALEFSYTRQSTIVNNRVVIKTKPWRYGIAGTGSCMQRNVVDVDLSKGVTGALAFAIRHPRRAGNTRLTGNIISNCTSNGKLGFIDDVKEFEAVYIDKLEMPAGKCEYPFAFTHMLADCQFDGGNQKYNHALVRSAKNGSIVSVHEIGSPSVARPGLDSGYPSAMKGDSRWIAYNPAGKVVARGTGSAPGALHLSPKLPAAGIFIITNGAQHHARRLVMTD